MQTLLKDLLLGVFLVCLTMAFGTFVKAADVVPTEIQMPGTQPNEVGNFESPDKCDNCHAGYNDLDPGAEPATGWRGAAMGNAGRDPVFWATLAVAEQDFDGAGDLCIRCHSAGGWYGGRSTPTDGSGLAASDDNGIDCDTCHASTNTNDLGVTNTAESGDTPLPLQGLMFSPFIANCDGDSTVLDKCDTGEGFYGSGMLSLWPTVNEKLGPFENSAARHQFSGSKWHRDPDFCGTCHDVSNSAVGDLAPGNGAQPGNPHSVVSSWDLGLTVNVNGEDIPVPELGGAIENKAAFNNPPYAYGIVERTFSEYKSSPLSSTLVSKFNDLPDDLKTDPSNDEFNGSLEVTYKAAIAAGTGGNYADGTERYFSCQSCHMRPVGGNGAPGCNKNGAPVRADLPRHDHTGGNYWFASMTQYQDNADTLRLGGGLNSTQLLAMDLGQDRAVKHLTEAGSLEVIGNTVKVTNLTGHKLITGYPEGRRMWLNIEWYDNDSATPTIPVRVDGEYGSLTVDLDQDGQVDDTVETIVNLDDPNTKIYEAHYAMTKEWADVLLAVDYPSSLALAYDREDGTVTETLGSLAAKSAGSYVDTFHFAINNYVSKDNRIPPYQMSYDEAQKRNALPVPADQYGNPEPGGTYDHWDIVDLNPPAGADYAKIKLLYQGTSWEYIQFLQLANNGQNAFLGQEGDNMMDAWLNASVKKSNGDAIVGVMDVNDSGEYKMVPPVIMAEATWGAAGNSAPTCSIDSPATDVTIDVGQSVNYAGTATDSDGTIASYSWNFPGGTPASSSVRDPGNVTYNTAGVYTTSFTATDNEGEPCTAATVQVTVTTVGSNNAPVANHDSYTTANDTELNGNVLDNDTDADNDNLAVVDAPRSESLVIGGVSLETNGSFTFTPNGSTGSYSFSYIANDGTDDSNTATVTITTTEPAVCGNYTTRKDCNNAGGCKWNKNAGVCEEDPAACTPNEDPEISCTDGADNDCNGATDCADANCSGVSACQTTCDNDGVCDPGEDCQSCVNDCAGMTGGKPANRYCCGNGVAEGPEGDGSICDGNY